MFWGIPTDLALCRYCSVNFSLHGGGRNIKPYPDMAPPSTARCAGSCGAAGDSACAEVCVGNGGRGLGPFDRPECVCSVQPSRARCRNTLDRGQGAPGSLSSAIPPHGPLQPRRGVRHGSRHRHPNLGRRRRQCRGAAALRGGVRRLALEPRISEALRLLLSVHALARRGRVPPQRLGPGKRGR